MYSVLRTAQKAGKQVQKIVMQNQIAVLLGVIALIVSIVIMSKKENFTGIVAGSSPLAKYPAAFAKKVIEGAKDIVYDNYFLSEKKSIALPAHTATVNVDIGNGMAVATKVSVPAQKVEIPDATPIAVPTPATTQVKVAAQKVELPAQVGIIEAKVEGTGESVPVPVSIPAQVVDVPQQKAIIPVIEPFFMYPKQKY